MTARPHFRAIKDYITTLSNERHNAPLILAVSGGVDSIWMVDFVAGCQVPFTVAHFRHNLRSNDEQDKDLHAINEMARKHHALIQSVQVGNGYDIRTLARSTGNGIEAVAREQRYAFLKYVAKQRDWADPEPILTAHHADDQVETVLLNLMRGCSHDKLAMKDVQDGIYRPFLSVAKSDILSLSKAKGLLWNDDVTNDDTHADRNWIRHEVLPKLNERRNVTKAILTGLGHTD